VYVVYRTVGSPGHFEISRFVPETLLKKRKTQKAARARVVAAHVKSVAAAHKKKAEIHKRAETYVREYRVAERALVRQRRQARATGNYFVEPEAKLALVVRIRGIIGTSPKVRKILQLLRLRQINNAVFIRINGATNQMLQMVAPYIAWGYPNLKTVRELVYKRGFAKINKQRIALSDNAIIEKALGSKNIICMEDLIHELYTVGPNFKEANSFLWPFKLSSPLGGFNQKLLGFCEGGDHGNREGEINALAASML